MKKIASLLALILVIALILPGCTRVGSSMNGSGKIMDTILELEDFSSLNIKGPFMLEVIQAPDYKATLSVDDNLVNRVKVSLERKTLNLSIEAPATFFPTSLKLKIEMPELVSLTLADSASAVVNGFKDTQNFTVFLSGKSILKCAAQLETLELNVSGASDASFKGQARQTNIDARGASKIDLQEFVSTYAQIKMTEASEATMNVTGPVDITLENSSKFFYTGTPIFGDTTISGGSTMAPK